jgi:hypothetical protein
MALWKSEGQTPRLAFQTEARGAPTTLAHELGQYLGLEHIEDETIDRECAAELLNPCDEVSVNLMTSYASRTARLSVRQISREREMAYRYLTEWGISSSGCAGW